MGSTAPYSVAQDAAFAAVAKAPADRIDRCQGENDDLQLPVMLVFKKRDGRIFLFWSTEGMSNHVDTVWPYWNLLDFTPEGRPDRQTPPQRFKSEFLEKNYLNKE